MRMCLWQEELIKLVSIGIVSDARGETRNLTAQSQAPISQGLSMPCTSRGLKRNPSNTSESNAGVAGADELLLQPLVCVA